MHQQGSWVRCVVLRCIDDFFEFESDEGRVPNGHGKCRQEFNRPQDVAEILFRHPLRQEQLFVGSWHRERHVRSQVAHLPWETSGFVQRGVFHVSRVFDRQLCALLWWGESKEAGASKRFQTVNISSQPPIYPNALFNTNLCFIWEKKVQLVLIEQESSPFYPTAFKTLGPLLNVGFVLVLQFADQVGAGKWAAG